MAEEVKTAQEDLPAPDGEVGPPVVDLRLEWKKVAILGVGLLAAGIVGLAVNEYLMRRFAAKRAALAQAWSEQEPPPPSQPPPPAETGETGTSVPKHLAPIEHPVDSPVPVEIELELEEEGEASERLGG